MGSKRAKQDSSTDDCSSSVSNTSMQGENTDRIILQEISNKLSMIMSAIQDLTNIVRSNNCRRNIEASEYMAMDISKVVEEITKKLPIQNIVSSNKVSATSAELSTNIIEVEALKVKSQITNLWSARMQQRRDAYWNMVKNQGHHKYYSSWIEATPPVIPRYLQKKEFNNENNDQKSIRERSVINEFRTEIELRCLRASSSYEKAIKIDDEMKQIILSKCNGDVARYLIEMWATQTKRNEDISHKRWEKNNNWLKAYEENFRKEYTDKNPYFKKNETQNNNYQRQTRPTYAEIVQKQQPKRNIQRPRRQQYNQKNEQDLTELLSILMQKINNGNNRNNGRNRYNNNRNSRRNFNSNSNDDSLLVEDPPSDTDSFFRGGLQHNQSDVNKGDASGQIMRRFGHHDRYTGSMKRFIGTHKVQEQINQLSYLQSAELVTPCRLFLVLIGSVVMILLISLSISSDEITSTPFLSDDRVNLTKEPYQMNYRTVQQMREEMLENYGYSPSENKVEKRSDLSLQEFWDLYDGKWPIIVLDIVPNWHAYKSWSKDFFYNNYGSDRIILKAVEGVLNEGVAYIRDMKTFISYLEQPSQPDSWTYMEDEMFLMLRPELRKHIEHNFITEENFFNLFPYEVRPWDCMMLWGTKYSRSTLHMDPYNWTAISAVIWGRKKWKLFPPGQDHYLYIQPGNKCGFPLECKKYDSMVDAFEPDYWKFPKFRKAEYIEVEQNSGEMLVIPSGWYHQAYNDEETLSISMELMNRNNYLIVLEEIIRGKNLSRKKLPAHFHTLLPPDQVKLFMSLLPKKIIKHGKEVTDDLLNTLDVMRNQTSDL